MAKKKTQLSDSTDTEITEITESIDTNLNTNSDINDLLENPVTESLQEPVKQIEESLLQESSNISTDYYNTVTQLRKDAMLHYIKWENSLKTASSIEIWKGELLIWKGAGKDLVIKDRKIKVGIKLYETKGLKFILK
jgi:hypothetical protein